MVDTVVLAGTIRTDRVSMGGADTLTVEIAGALSVSANAQAVRFNAPTSGATIVNDGIIEAVGAQAEPRAIRFESTVGATLNATIINNATGTIRSANDAIQIQSGAVTGGTVHIINSGEITSIDGQAVDFAGATGTFVTELDNSGTISSVNNDAVRIGAIGHIVNSGTINAGTAAAYGGSLDGIQFEDDATGTVENKGTGAISGDRHGINVGESTDITVINGPGASITGRNGSGVGSDGTATVINYGVITGAFSDSIGSDINGPGGGGVPDGVNDGDGDGVDIDFEATIVNYGIIQGTGAGGHGSDGLANTSEGIAAGGGTITNHAKATISGVGIGILVDDSSQGNAPFVTTIVNDGTVSGAGSFGIRIVSDLDDTIDNGGTISGGGGTAIQFGSGNNTLKLRQGSVITGLTDGGAGNDTLDYSAFGRSVKVNLAAGTATGTGGVAGFDTVIGSAKADVLIGSSGAESLFGGAGNDWLSGGAGADTISGGAGNDVYYYDLGDTLIEAAGEGNDTVIAGASLTLADNFENLLLTRSGNFNGSGNAANNTIVGNCGANVLLGLGGNDVLFGGAGNDLLRGGAGRDLLNGGAGADRFDFDLVADSAVGAGRDAIYGFSRWQGDRIDLLDIDANVNLAGDQAFAFIGRHGFTGAAGQLRFAGGVVSGDVDGDRVADFQIQVHSVSTLTATDFLL
ncbi:hypothetical protein MesoLjLc_52860 [Mesorhizobium sp. L-8-10]|uniref:beta strand repeat-containing protein n=1 Tax=Mesorhizobium sp. L-8-10 TaxID=2744523 RepID=UPI001927E762|nr:calcium-binding protein [Mesorhizobium sp. L-8-10]BCH33356.1 hypothetical protein MesoLjLc_52860 [Mesorhizobium sp. L-8-10]